MKLLHGLLFGLLLAAQGAQGGNLRQISSREGISNNAILSLAQDKSGYIWVGSCDGLNLWDGERMRLFPNDWRKQEGLSGNIIEEIAQTTDSLFWVRTNYGLDLFNPEDKSVERHPRFQGMYAVAVRSSNEVIVLTQENTLWYYDPQLREFAAMANTCGLQYDRLLCLYLDHSDNLWIFDHAGIRCLPITFPKDGGPIRFGTMRSIALPHPPEHVSAKDEHICFIDTQKTLYEFDLANGQVVYKKDMSSDLEGRGNVSSIVRDGEDYFVSFYTNGVIRLCNTPQNSVKYVTEQIDVPCGVFSLLRDRRQDIVWIGSDGQGLYQHTHNDVAFRSITYHDLPYNLSKPIRAFHLDREGVLWVGTKGEGMLRIHDFYASKPFDETRVELLTPQNSQLLDNSVYAFAPSRRNLLWIGTDGDGLNYYSYRDRAIRTLHAPEAGRLKYIHGLCETDTGTLWAATVGSGVYRIEIGGTDDRPEIVRMEPLRFNDELEVQNFFFTLYPESDSIMWFGNRGGGAVRYNMQTRRSEVFRFDRERNALANDIFALCRSRSGRIWFGTSGGLFPLDEASAQLHATRNTVHGILEDSQQNLWLSTNQGLIKYSPDTHNAVTYGYSYGLNTIEYSDGAFFADPATGVLFFGGTNGLVTVARTSFQEQPCNPPVLFRDVRINNDIYSVESLLSDSGLLTLRHGERLYELSAAAIDYINGSNYTYYSRLEGYDTQWTTSDGHLYFADLPAGTYRLNVRYYNNITGAESPVYTLQIRIRPPWYTSAVAIFAYLMLGMIIVGATIRYYVMRYRQRRAARKQRHEVRRKEELYESKIRLFSNITQELTMPLTMISGPCQQILGYPRADSYIQHYAQTIRQNVSKLHNLIHMLREFRGIRDIEHNENIVLVPVSELAAGIVGGFAEYADQNGIHSLSNIEPDLVWPTDQEGLSTILDTLLSNAFKHTPVNGSVHLTVRCENQELIIVAANDSLGVDLDDIEAIFDRYRVLDYFERKSEQGLSFQGDLRLAICHSIVLRMEGNIIVESTPNDMTTFTVRLPHLTLSDQQAAPSESPIVPIDHKATYGLSVVAPRRHDREYQFDKERQTMFIMNENPEIMDFIADLFVADYNIKMPSDLGAMDELLKQMHPDLILCGAFSPQSECLEMIARIKQNKLTAHIPVILFSTAQQVNERIKGVESGADICLTLPFNIDYLKAVAEQLLRRNRSLKDYYKSSISAFELSDGRMLHQDDKEFIDRMLQIINDNISNTEISTRFIADQMGVSVRNLYRRLEGILNQTPTNIIKEARLSKAEQLLTTTKLSIDEIIYKAGFVNRGTFFKCFATKYGCTPKIYRKQKLVQVHEATNTSADPDSE